ncbi:MULTISPECIES: AAA family ATPase [unclassified Novosphingobium]|uniref:chromosome segregation SMC family protein n=1 Tax=unclassified Novosphingobium TaxID=2644732 RepID=UPI00146D6BC9|nr:MULTISPECIES: AAA family ATPase [unclassified Novosphingobium]NMN03336.1 chromosome segregation protein [Novosphingobium sp. SG919]NMN86674.1 chromosome segregation protein [Novosphingobium sp. SG916]
MHFQRLKLAGFKSFVEPAELRIEPGLTGVVGPNGCGKSNLLEALRWVMGEASAKAMRGAGMDDVIFAGSASRPARAFAEVALTAQTDADDQWGGELEVVRRIERGAGSAYRVNGRDVRAKDVGLIFADAATGAHSPALVSQGRIAAVIAAKPAERRMMLEEAAGIAGLHVRRRDAEQKLRATEANLARLEDLMAGLDGQIATLRRQARSAERYKAVTERIRVAEARLVFARWRDAAAAAQAARDEAARAEAAVAGAQAATVTAQGAQHGAATALAAAREELFDRRQDASAHGQRMAALSAQLEAAEQRVADIDRQLRSIAEDRAQADQLTAQAAQALSRLESDLAAAQATLLADEARRPLLAAALDDAERAARVAELAQAQAQAEQAGVEADWRVAQAALAAAQAALARLEAEGQRLATQQAALAGEPDPALALAEAERRRTEAAATLASQRARRDELTATRESLTQARDAAANALATARAELAGVAREAEALARDKAARAKAAAARGRGPAALSGCRVAPGWERALAAVLGRDAMAPLGPAPQAGEGRFWTGANAPEPLPDALLHHVPTYPPELAARLALVRAVDADEGQPLGPGEWLVTRGGHLRRWDGFVARGEGAAEAAALEADNRLAELEARRPALEAAVQDAQSSHDAARDGLAQVQAEWSGVERAIGQAAEAERSALRALDQAEAARAQREARAADLTRQETALAQQIQAAQAEAEAARARHAALPDPAAGRATVDAARATHQTARASLQQAMAAHAALEQGLAVGHERLGGMKADVRNWQARAGDAAKRLAQMAGRADELATERTIAAAKPAGLIAEIEQGETIRDRLARELAAAEAALAKAESLGKAADAALAQANEALALAREARATASTKATHEDQRRQEMAGISGERFQCPPPLLPERFAFAGADVGEASAESAAHERLVAERERIGPVNLVAADELAQAEARQAESLAEQAELAEAVNRLRGSIGNLNREGRERLRAAFEAVDGHFRRLFTRLFGGGEAHLALVDSDDPLEAGLEIMAQPPGKRLQSLTLLSGGEQALTAVALIFGLFLTNPAPICVLDEVDAPLDDANIERFCDLLDAMVAETQTRYLIVTHNAVTMSRMHRLFGVTMVERGVSRLVSVDLGGAEDLLASAV